MNFITIEIERVYIGDVKEQTINVDDIVSFYDLDTTTTINLRNGEHIITHGVMGNKLREYLRACGNKITKIGV